MGDKSLTVIPGGNNALTDAMTVAEVREQVNRIQQIMKTVMKKDTHYGVIPGCPKPSLYKAGAEKLAVTFRIAVSSVVENLSTEDEVKFRTICEARFGDVFLGSAVGTCSSNEEKYKWRKPVCQEEFDETPEDRRRIKWAHKKGGGGYKQQQVRTNPADVENTVLQMSDKRGYVAVVRKVTAASDVFTQDIQDLPPDMVNGIANEEKPEIRQPQSKGKGKAAAATKKTAPPPAKGKISDGQRIRLFAKMNEASVSEDALKKHLLERYKLASTKDIKTKDYDALCVWVDAGGQDGPGAGE